MPERRSSFEGPFEALRRPITPQAPRAEFAASLRRRIEEELGMAVPGQGELVMVHVRVADADRAAAFFGALLGWESERLLVSGHVSHYTVNTEVTVRLLDDPDVPAVVPNYGVADVARAVRSIEEAGGRVTDAEAEPDGGGWARGADDQGVPLLVYRPGGYEGTVRPTRTPTGDVGLVFIRGDAGRAGRFYGSVLGWRLERSGPTSQYFDAVPRVGIFDEAAAFGRPVKADATLFLEVEALAPALAQVEELGGTAGPVAHDLGPYHHALCTDDQGTAFGLMALAIDAPARGR